MAVARKPRGKRKLRFELSLGAIGGITVVVFCLFLWMFLFGVWAGQSLLFPNYGKPTLTGEAVGQSAQTAVGKAEKSGEK